ncbi:MAG: hypothetical protein ABFD53_09140 [Anaerolineaceae bacterium]
MDQNIAPQQEVVPKKKSNIGWIIAIIVIVVICLCCAVVGFVIYYLWTYGDQIFNISAAYLNLLI